MTRFPRSWLSGFLNVWLQKAGASRRLMLDVFIPFASAFVTVRLLDRNQQEIEDNDANPVTLFESELLLDGPVGIPLEQKYQRQQQLFSGQRQFYHGNIPFDITDDVWRRCAHIVLEIAPIDTRDDSAVREQMLRCEPDLVYLEMSCKKLASGRPPALFLLISKEQAARRMEKIIRKQPVLLRRDQAVMLGLSSLMVKLFRGGDGPLLTEEV